MLAEGGDPAAALAALDALPPGRVATYQPFWVARARALGALDRPDEAQAAREAAIRLTRGRAVRAHLERG